MPLGTWIGTQVQGLYDWVFNEGTTLEPGPHAGESIPAQGPERDFTPEEREAINKIGKDLMNERRVSEARTSFYGKNAAVMAAGNNPNQTDKMVAPFGATGYLESGNPSSTDFSPARFFVGSYRIETSPINNGADVLFELKNDTTFTSFAHDAGFNSSGCCFGFEIRSWSQPLPGGSISQTYTWTEPVIPLP